MGRMQVVSREQLEALAAMAPSAAQAKKGEAPASTDAEVNEFRQWLLDHGRKVRSTMASASRFCAALRGRSGPRTGPP